VNVHAPRERRHALVIPSVVEEPGRERARGSRGHRPLQFAGELTVENRHEIIIFWSHEDDAFIADVPELPGCMAHGSSHADALKNAEEAIGLWIETARELLRPIPEPKGRRLMYA
jgi:predicted RNase H-like HicB family nuclease